MIKKSLLILTAIFVSSAFSVSQKVAKKADKVIAKFYEIEEFDKVYISVSESANEATPSSFSGDNFFRIESEGMLLGYGYIGNAPSKTATYDYLVLFDMNFIVSKSKVLIYREEYGGEIGSKRWLKQFIGTSSASSELVYNQDIIPISGATISVRSMTRAMNELLQSVGALQELKAI